MSLVVDLELDRRLAFLPLTLLDELAEAQRIDVAAAADLVVVLIAADGATLDAGVTGVVVDQRRVTLRAVRLRTAGLRVVLRVVDRRAAGLDVLAPVFFFFLVVDPFAPLEALRVVDPLLLAVGRDAVWPAGLSISSAAGLLPVAASARRIAWAWLRSGCSESMPATKPLRSAL